MTEAAAPIRFRDRACPVCGGHGEVVARHVDPDIQRYGLAPEPVPLRACATCDMRFFELIESVNTAGEIYARMPMSADSPRRRHRVLARLIQELGLGQRGLELGCGACHVGRALPATHRVVAVDQSPRVDAAPAHVEFIDADITDLADDRFTRGEFDWILIDNVLEHLPDVAPLVERAAHWLAADGVFIVSVPNGATLKRILGGRHAAEVHRPVEHVNVFRRKTLDAVFARAACSPRRRGFVPHSAFELGVLASLNGWPPFGLYRIYGHDKISIGGGSLDEPARAP